MSTHYIKLKDNVFLNTEEAEKIRKLQLHYDNKFTFEDGKDSSIELFGEGTEEYCLSKIDTFGDIKELFEISKR